jgi:hypothetical protein
MASNAAATEVKDHVPIVWERTFEDGLSSRRVRAIGLVNDRGLFVAGTYKEASSAAVASGRVWVWRISPTGQLTSSLDLRNVSGTDVLDIEAIEPISGLDYLAVLVAEDGRRLLVRSQSNGGITTVADLGHQQVYRLVRGVDGRLFVVGAEKNRALAVVLTAAGATIKAYRSEDGKDSVYLDAVMLHDALMLVKNTGIREQFFWREAVVTTVLLNDNGLSAPIVLKAGRGGDIAALADRVVIVYDIENDIRQDIFFSLTRNAGTTVSEGRLAKTDLGLERFKVAPLGADGFVVAGASAGRLYVQVMDQDGRLAGRTERLGDSFYADVYLAGDSTATYLVASRMVLVGRDRTKTLVDVVRLGQEK